uniref:GUN4-like domain-containing protein n=1 Tax=Sonderella linearis TaxID=110477 RepID=A0A1Z1MLH1_9FLOR|nr:hypothetical protein [Sonderella linearis]ARW66950.1 hypothetical protein [Sonderella linearis]
MKLNNNINYLDIKNIDLIYQKKLNFISKEIEHIIDKILNKGKTEQKILVDLIIKRIIKEDKEVSILDGLIFTKLIETKIPEIKTKLYQFFPNGILILKPSLKINYQPLQNLLINKDFKEADKLTQKYLCNLVELKNKNKKNWLYFTDIQFLPLDDLFTLDLMWKIYSKGKFGFSVQKTLWIKYNCKWKQLWEKIGWTAQGIMKRYPEEFIWTIDAPKGHLPLFNQLRGTQTLSALFKRIK